MLNHGNYHARGEIISQSFIHSWLDATETVDETFAETVAETSPSISRLLNLPKKHTSVTLYWLNYSIGLKSGNFTISPHKCFKMILIVAYTKYISSFHILDSRIEGHGKLAVAPRRYVPGSHLKTWLEGFRQQQQEQKEKRREWRTGKPIMQNMERDHVEEPEKMEGERKKQSFTTNEITLNGSVLVLQGSKPG